MRFTPGQYVDNRIRLIASYSYGQLEGTPSVMATSNSAFLLLWRTVTCPYPMMTPGRLYASHIPCLLWGDTTGHRFKGPVIWSFDITFVDSLHNLMNKQSSCRCFQAWWGQCNVNVNLCQQLEWEISRIGKYDINENRVHMLSRAVTKGNTGN